MTNTRGVYAANTKVPVSQSKSELEHTLDRYGATHFAYGSSEDGWVIAFRYGERNYKIVLDRPNPHDYRYTTQLEQSERQRWRALILILKGKLEAVELGIETFEAAFLSNLMLPDGSTVGEWIEPHVERVYRENEMPPLLPGMASPVFRALPEGAVS
jgi:hypothetical protein